MIHNSSSAKTKLDSSPSKDSPYLPGSERPGEANDQAEPGAKLADLCDEDKAKVARLINQVLLAFREMNRLRDLLVEERKAHDSVTSKLREENQEMAAKLRLKLASMQNLLTPHQLHKVFLQPDKTAQSLTPTSKTDNVEARVPATALQVDLSEIRDAPTMKDGDCDQLMVQAETKSEHTVRVMKEEKLGGKFQKSDDQISSRPGGKENQHSELTASGAEFAQYDRLNEEALSQKRRPPPRPLPDLVVNILHAQKEAMCAAPNEQRDIIDTTSSLDRSSVVNTLRQKHEASSADAEGGKFLAPTIERGHCIDTESRQCEPGKYRDAERPKYFGESDESLRSSKSKKKMRFDPTAGEEGEFYYTSDICNSECDNVQEIQFHQTDEVRTVQCRSPPAELTCTRCTKPLNKKKVPMDCRYEITAEDGNIIGDRQKISFSRRGCLGVRDIEIPKIFYVTDEDYGPDSISRQKRIVLKNDYCSAGAETVSNLCSGHTQICLKCSSPLVNRLPKHIGAKKEWNQRERRQKYEIDSASLTSSVSEDSPLLSRSKFLSRCVRCSYLVTDNLKRSSTRTWKVTESEDDSARNSGSGISSGYKKVRSKKHVHKIYSDGFRPLGHTLRKGNRQLISDAQAQNISTPAVMTYETSGADSHLSPKSTAALTNTTKGRSFLVQPMSCNLQQRRTLTRQDNLSLEDHGDQSSELRSQAFQVNHDNVERELQSETENSESFKCSSRADEKVPRPRDHLVRIAEANCCSASAEGRPDLGSTEASTCPMQVERLLQSETENSEPFKCSSRVDKKVPRPRDHLVRMAEANWCSASAEGRRDLGSTEAGTCPTQAEPDAKLWVKNAGETPITLPKVYCKASTPKMWSDAVKQIVRDDERAEPGDMVSEKGSAKVEDLLGRFIRSNEECAAELIKCFQAKVAIPHVKGAHSSKEMISYQKAMPERKANQSEELQLKDSETSHVHLLSEKITLQQSTRCTGCLAVLKPEVSGTQNKNDTDVNCTEVLCGKCSTSRGILKNLQILSSPSEEVGKDPGPRSPTDKYVESNTQQDGITLTSLETDRIPRGLDHETSIVADDANKGKLENTIDWQIGVFDVSLFQLVNDLEVEETEYWEQINTPAVYENLDFRKYDTRRNRMVLEKGQASTTSRWCYPKRNTNRHFR